MLVCLTVSVISIEIFVHLIKSAKMTLFDSDFAIHFNRTACFYINKTSKIQIIRITNIPYLYWERVVFPMQRLIFNTVPEAKLEIYSSECVTTPLAEIIPLN